MSGRWVLTMYDYSNITARTIPEAHRRIVYRVWNFGKEVVDERGDVIRELLDVHIKINTDDCTHVKNFETMDNDFAEGLLNKKFAIKKGNDFVYAYGDRIYTFNQLEKTIQSLIDNPSTRRAYIPIYRWDDNSKFIEDVPCWTSLQFLIRDEKLHMIDYFRSNDVFYAMPSDIYGARSLQYYVAAMVTAGSLEAGKPGVSVGNFTHHIGSAHIRMTDEDAVLNFL